jgi:uncharacterized protein (DUF488 family)
MGDYVMSQPKVLCTIGTSEKNLRRFIELLQSAGVTKVIDIRLHNTSQLAGYSKKDDLAFVLEAFGIQYAHVPELAPTEEIIKAFKKVDKDWAAFEHDFKQLMEERNVTAVWKSPVLDEGVNCLLCAEHLPTHCHRRLVAERFQAAYPELEVRHLK